MTILRTEADLETIYGTCSEASLVKEIDFLSPGYPRCSFMFMVPGNSNVVRVNGRAEIDVDPELCASFEMEGKAPRSAIRLQVEKAYFQCARAIMRADLWGEIETVPDLPTPGQMMKEITEGAFDGDQYDQEWPERAKTSMW